MPESEWIERNQRLKGFKSRSLSITSSLRERDQNTVNYAKQRLYLTPRRFDSFDRQANENETGAAAEMSDCFIRASGTPDGAFFVFGLGEIGFESFEI